MTVKHTFEDWHLLLHVDALRRAQLHGILQADQRAEVLLDAEHEVVEQLVVVGTEQLEVLLLEADLEWENDRVYAENHSYRRKNDADSAIVHGCFVIRDGFIFFITAFHIQ